MKITPMTRRDRNTNDQNADSVERKIQGTRWAGQQILG
jgi:hypothetical protein